MKNHRSLTPRQEALAERNLYTAIAALRDTEEVRAFFRDLCTPAELQAMADRWSVVDFLSRGLPYREIHDLTGVSVTTIGRVARFLATGHGGYGLVAERLGKWHLHAAHAAASALAEPAAPQRAAGLARRREGARNG
jgi:TrpR-related protein YerC/YecD